MAKNSNVFFYVQTLLNGSGSSGKETDLARVTVTQRLLEQVVCGCMGAWKVYRPGTISGDGALVCNVCNSATLSIVLFLKKTRLKLKSLLTGYRFFFLLFQVSHSWSKIKSRGGPPALFGHSAIKVCLELLFACNSFSRLLPTNLFLPSNRFRLVYRHQELNEF